MSVWLCYDLSDKDCFSRSESIMKGSSVGESLNDILVMMRETIEAERMIMIATMNHMSVVVTKLMSTSSSLISSWCRECAVVVVVESAGMLALS